MNNLMDEIEIVNCCGDRVAVFQSDDTIEAIKKKVSDRKKDPIKRLVDKDHKILYDSGHGHATIKKEDINGNRIYAIF